jgi:hypothetical protein
MGSIMEVKTQGTELFFVNSSAVVLLTCPTGITGLGGPADQIDSTCLSDLEDRKYTRGLGNPGTVSVPFNMHPDATSQQALFTLKAAGTTVNWMVCLSDGTTAPTVDTDDMLVAPAGRTSFGFDGYVSDLNIDVATNEIVRGTLTIQRSGAITEYWNA